MKIKLLIFYKSGDIDDEDICGKERSLSEYNKKEVIFYDIDYIAPYVENGITYIEIGSGGISFISPLQIKQVEELIDKQNNIWEQKIN